MVVLKRMLPQSEKAVLVVISEERFWRWRVENDLIKQVRRLLIQGQIPQLVNDQKCRFRIDAQLADERMIDLRRIQMVQHVHGGSE